jgi:hypothetical protein
MNNSAYAIGSLTILVQKKLGIQQAQSINRGGLLCDVISQLTGVRGSQADLISLYKMPSKYLEGPGSDNLRVQENVKVLIRSMVIRFNKKTGEPEAFRPFCPSFINSAHASKWFRGVGATVVGGLLGGRTSDIASEINAIARNWERHQVAGIFKSFCVADGQSAPEEKSYLRDVCLDNTETPASRWIRDSAEQDWRAWIKLVPSLSIEEQMESLATLAGLQLHRLMQIQLTSNDETGVLCLAPSAVNTAASTNIYTWYRHQVTHFIRKVAENEVDRIASLHPALADFASENIRNIWMTQVKFESRGNKESEKFRAKFSQKLQDEISAWLTRNDNQPLTDAAGREAVVNAYISTTVGLDKKIVSYFRDTGAIGEIVGPPAARHKRHVIGPQLLSLLASLHCLRDPADVRTLETEKNSISAFFDDVRARYGIVLSKGRAHFRGQEWASSLPPSLEENGAEISSSLERMGQLRRYSDHSAVLVR